jgi:hypothetical protein
VKDQIEENKDTYRSLESKYSRPSLLSSRHRSVDSTPSDSELEDP